MGRGTAVWKIKLPGYISLCVAYSHKSIVYSHLCQQSAVWCGTGGSTRVSPYVATTYVDSLRKRRAKLAQLLWTKCRIDPVRVVFGVDI